MSIAEKLTIISENVSKVYEAGFGVRPSGSVSITENGTYDVTDKAEAVVNVPTETDVVDGVLDGTITSIRNDRITKTVLYAFGYRKSLVSAEFPNLKTLAGYSFHACSALQRVELQSVSRIENSVFNSCEKFETLIIGSPNVCYLQTATTFNGTPIASGTGYIYVPDELVDAYKTATNWSALANQIKGISELEETA